MSVLGNRFWVCTNLESWRKKVDQQAGFAAGTYCSASTRYLVLDGDDPCWRKRARGANKGTKINAYKQQITCNSQCE